MTTAVGYHKIAGKFYSDLFDRERKATKQIVPELLGETVHHYVHAGDRRRVQDLAFYREELKVAARSHYRNGEQDNYDMAFREYKAIAEMDQKNADAQLHLALIYARRNQWSNAERHFGKASELQPNAHWILQAFGAAKLRADKIAEAEHLLKRAEELNPNYSPTLVDLGRLYERQQDFDSAEGYYRQAVEADCNNSFAYSRLARLLYRLGEIKEAFEMAKAALATKPVDERNKALVREFRDKLNEKK